MFCSARPMHAQEPEPVRVFTAFTDTSGSIHVAVDLENDVLVIARNTPLGGTVRIHARNNGGADIWDAIAVIEDDRPGFGRSIDLHNGLLAIGVDGGTGAGATAGSTIVLRVDASPLIDPVLQLDEVVANDGFAGDRFGYTVHWRGDTLLVGAIGRGHPDGTGAVYFFRRAGDDWGPIGSVQPDVFDFQLPVLGDFGAMKIGRAHV